MKNVFLAVSVLLIMSTSASAERNANTAIKAGGLTPFTSDGCSAFPDGTFEQNELWLSCCQAHDFAYWQGGTYTQRKRADEVLEICVAAINEPGVALLMLTGVRVGGTPFLPTGFRWGYGWPFPRGYGVLSAEELDQIERAIKEI